MMIFERGIVTSYVANAMTQGCPNDAFYTCGACGRTYRAKLQIYIGEWIGDHIGNALCFRCLEDMYLAVASHVQHNGEGPL